MLTKDAQRMFEFGACTGKTSYLWARNQPADGAVTTLTLAPTQRGAYHSETGDDPDAEDFAMKESAFTRFLYTGTDVVSDTRKTLLMARPGGLVPSGRRRSWHSERTPTPEVDRCSFCR